MRRRRTYLALALATSLGLIAYQVFDRDYFRWPNSAQERIEVMADVLRRIEGPASWCYSAGSAQKNLAADRRVPPGAGQCFAKLVPTSDFIEEHPREFMKRFYGAEVDGFVCEVTLSTFWNDEHIVGSRCYYGVFNQGEFPFVGATDEPFG
ncbi:hypothetical protein [Tabrizicola fusiformis]|uniref:hypothetical protein n=1 Tax=Tabrizicola sp. SY72 TaxID=2741673 RepID=UPI001572238D|nr:hypothetical protein [Tabrizicola sp. SY72]NTT87337.1 hypothetical protein [Tabrizicola sp. SY72]